MFRTDQTVEIVENHSEPLSRYHQTACVRLSIDEEGIVKLPQRRNDENNDNDTGTIWNNPGLVGA
jgi:hypothetical protein